MSLNHFISDFPLRRIKERIAIFAAQEPAKDRMDAALPSHAQEGYHGGGGKETVT
jgi:hypothetical protein